MMKRFALEQQVWKKRQGSLCYKLHTRQAKEKAASPCSCTPPSWLPAMDRGHVSSGVPHLVRQREGIFKTY